MKKLSKLQKKWIADYAGDDDHLEYLLDLLTKLKVLKQRDAIGIRKHIRGKVNEWVEIDWRRRAKADTYEEEKQSYGPPPRSIKSTRARSRY